MDKEEFEKLYKSLPKVLQDAYFSEENLAFIDNLVEKNQLNNHQREQILQVVNNVLLGMMPIEYAQEVFEEEVEINPESERKKVYLQLYRGIFSPVKEALISLYKMEEEEEISLDNKQQKIEHDF